MPMTGWLPAGLHAIFPPSPPTLNGTVALAGGGMTSLPVPHRSDGECEFDQRRQRRRFPAWMTRHDRDGNAETGPTEAQMPGDSADLLDHPFLKLTLFLVSPPPSLSLPGR